MVHAITNGEDPNEVDVKKHKKERRLSEVTSNDIGKLGAVDKNSRAAELEKMIKSSA